MPTKKVVLLGGTGLLGGVFKEILQSDKTINLIAPARAELDLIDCFKLEKFLANHKPDVVINCAGYNQVDKAETELEEKELCLALNSELPANLGTASKKLGFLLIQFSSDYVFDGANLDGYSEDSVASPINFYGKSKAEGEKRIMASTGKYWIFRISWLFGGNKSNFVLTMLNLAEQSAEIKVVNDQFGKPTYAVDVAKTVISLLKRDIVLASGIYHLPNEGSASWYEFAVKVFEFSGKNANIKPSFSADLDRPALRPKVSILINSKLPWQRPWPEALREYILKLNKD